MNGALPKAAAAAAAVGLGHLALAVALQALSYGAFVAPAEDTVLSPAQALLLWPWVQLPSLIGAAVLAGIVFLLLAPAAGRRWASLAVAFAANAALLVDQQIYGVFYEHIGPQLIDIAGAGQLPRLLAAPHWTLAPASAAVLLATYAAYRALFVGQWRLDGDRLAELRRGFQRPGTALALGAFLGISVIASVNVDMAKLNGHPLTQGLQEAVLRGASPLQSAAPVNVHAPRFARTATSRNEFFVKPGEILRWGVRDGEWRYEATVFGTQATLVDGATDPQGANNLAARWPGRVAYYQRLCAAWFAKHGDSASARAAGFVWNGSGWWQPGQLNMAGPKQVAFGVREGNRGDGEFSTASVFNPYDPILARLRLLPSPGLLRTAFEWVSPSGARERFDFPMQPYWETAWLTPGAGLPLEPGVWTLYVRQDDALILAQELRVDPAQPARVDFAAAPRAVQQLEVGIHVEAGAESGGSFLAQSPIEASQVPRLEVQWDAGAGLRKIRYEWRSPRGEQYSSESGLRSEWDRSWVLMPDEAPREPGIWEVSIWQDGLRLAGTRFEMTP